MKTKNLHHICIQTNNYQKSIGFYTKILGFEIVKETSNFHGRHYNTWLKLDTFLIEMQTPKIGELLNEFNPNTEGIVHFCIYVYDIQSEYQKIKQLGCSFLSKNGEDIYKVEGGRLFKIIAPEGTIIEIRDNEGI
jgi:glyoxylase I family protein